MVAGTAMAKKLPKNKARQGPGFRTLGIRMTDEYAAWLAGVAKFDRMTIAAFLDKAAEDRAKAIGFKEPAPGRLP
jgi:hypothetical protein